MACRIHTPETSPCPERRRIDLRKLEPRTDAGAVGLGDPNEDCIHRLGIPGLQTRMSKDSRIMGAQRAGIPHRVRPRIQGWPPDARHSSRLNADCDLLRGGGPRAPRCRESESASEGGAGPLRNQCKGRMDCVSRSVGAESWKAGDDRHPGCPPVAPDECVRCSSLDCDSAPLVPS